MPKPATDHFNHPRDFFEGQIIHCDHGDSRIDDTARSRNPGAYYVQRTGKIRPCLVVGVDTQRQKLWLAPMSSMNREVQHSGWEALEIINAPIQAEGTLTNRIWIGTPAVTSMIFRDKRNMYWCPEYVESYSPIREQNLGNYRLRHDAYEKKFGRDFDNSVPPPPRIHAGNASRLNPNPAGPSSRQLTQAPLHPQAHVRQQLPYQQQQMAQQYTAAQFQQQQMAQQYAAAAAQVQQQQMAQQYAAAQLQQQQQYAAAAGYSNQMQTPAGTRRYQVWDPQTGRYREVYKYPDGSTKWAS